MGGELPDGMCRRSWNSPRGFPYPFPHRMSLRHHSPLVILAVVGGVGRLYHLATPQKEERRNHLMWILFTGRILRRIFLIGLLLGAIAVLLIFGFSLRRLIILGVILLGLRFILRAARM